MNREKDYYQVLGVSPKASSNEIRQAYRRLATLNHPDRNPSTQATLRMQEINEAYSILGDKRKRAKYDSEYGFSSIGTPTSSAHPRTTTNLQQVFATDIVWRIDFRYLVIAIVVLTISTYILLASLPLPWWRMLSNWWWWVKVFWRNREPAFFAFFTAVFSLVSLSGIFFQMQLKYREFETQCPRCGKFRAAEKISKNLVDVPQRDRIDYRCKYCSYEWQFIKTTR